LSRLDIESMESWKQEGVGMGEVDKTLERLNEVLVNAGFAKVIFGVLYKGEDCWYANGCNIQLRFDKDGNYIKPEDGEY